MIRIQSCAKRIQELFETQEIARVHSVYRNTVNLQTSGVFLSVQPISAERTPLSINVEMPDEEFSLIMLKRGDYVQITQNGFVLDRHCFAIDNRTEFFNTFVGTRFERKTKLSSGLMKALDIVLTEMNYRGGFSDLALRIPGGAWANSAIAVKAEEMLSKIVDYGFSDNWEKAAESSACMIGLGEGLTPSGDDFNIGMLAALWHTGGNNKSCKFRKCLTEAISGICSETNDISREFLLRACEGEFSPAITGIFESDGDCTFALNKVAKIGHSSGVDTLNGIYTALLTVGINSNN